MNDYKSQQNSADKGNNELLTAIFKFKQQFVQNKSLEKYTVKKLYAITRYCDQSVIFFSIFWYRNPKFADCTLVYKIHKNMIKLAKYFNKIIFQ